MKKGKNILIAFWLNLIFSFFELGGGVFTGSTAIMSDALHDFGDALSIGISCFLERISKKHPDEKYTYGYGRYSLLGGIITTAVLIAGSVGVIFNAVIKLFDPPKIDYNGMLIFAVIGVAVNLTAALVTRGGKGINQRAVNLHMLEDVLGWLTVLVGAIVMKFTDLTFIDPVMSIATALFILISSLKNLKKTGEIFLERIPVGYSISQIRSELCELEGIVDVHHIHLRSFDEENIFAELHIVVSDEKNISAKHTVFEKLVEMGITHATIETEPEGDCCNRTECHATVCHKPGCCHSHH